MSGIPHDFLWNTTYIDASATQTSRFYQRHPGAVLGCAPRPSDATAAPTDNQKIIMCAHPEDFIRSGLVLTIFAVGLIPACV